MRRISSIWRHQGGNTAIVFGLAAIPLLALGGGAVDFAYRAKIRGELQSGADAGAIAAARTLQSGQIGRIEDQEALKAEARVAAERLIQARLAQFDASFHPETDIDIGEDTVTISARLDVPTSFLGVIGIDELGATALSEVNLPDPTLVEIALVLDYSGSMRDNDKYIRMTAAARKFIDRVKVDRADRAKVGIVPFSEYVYANVPGGVIRGTSAGEANTEMAACLLNRDYPYSVTDEAPYAAVPESRWPRVASSEPKCQAYEAGDLRVRDLTSDFAALDAALAGMEPAGLTNIALASEMGWHMLSPDRPFETARDYSDEHLNKILILLTDGMQTVNAMGPSGEISTFAADEATAEVCENAKDAGLRVFTIAYDITEERIRTLLSGCASSPASYFEPDASQNEISAVFDEIFAQISESVWLSR